MRAPKFLIYLVLVVVIFLVAISLPAKMFHTVPPGHAALLVSKFSGVEREKVIEPGFKVTFPWDRLIVYDMRLQTDSLSMSALTVDGVWVTTQVAYFFKPDKSRLANLNDEINTDYKRNIITPEVRDAVLNVFGKYHPEDFYSTKRDTIQSELQAKIAVALDKKYIKLDKLLVKSIILPAAIHTALENVAADRIRCCGQDAINH